MSLLHYAIYRNPSQNKKRGEEADSIHPFLISSKHLVPLTDVTFAKDPLTLYFIFTIT
ncbi:MAG TPA: hypothetical protein VK476_02900 [Flavobacterium sp.]|nr:hypothetical protein [Flavobacterium sp.]